MSVQSKADSWREALLNFGLTVVIGTCIWYEVILRLDRWEVYDPFTATGALITTAIYTVVSVLRRYVVRRRTRCGQSRKGSWVESLITTSLFMLAAWAVWVGFINPHLIEPGVLDKHQDGFLINLSIAASMIPLGYLIRRASIRFSARGVEKNTAPSYNGASASTMEGKSYD